MRIKKKKRVYYAVGDVHGMSLKLAKMLRLIAEDAKQYQDQDYLPVLVGLGDYVDRGPDSKGVVDLLIEGVPGLMPVYLCGNHEYMLMMARYQGGDYYHAWLTGAGGAQCLKSYEYRGNSSSLWLLPKSHIEFFSSLRAMWVTKKYIFAHAGIDPRLPLDQQKSDAENGPLWIREPFLSYDGKFEGNRTVIHGHTPSRKGVVVKHNRICLDTAACYRGNLSCAVLTNNDEPRFIIV